MHVELIGSTSSGKSTLAAQMLQTFRAAGIDAVASDSFVLQQVRLNWVGSDLLRTLLLDVCSLGMCLATWRTNRGFYRFVLSKVRSLPPKVGRYERYNLLRNVFKKAGIFEIIKRRGAHRDIILVDEGTLQSAHNLFVHVSQPFDRDEIAAFAALVQLPDAVLYVAQAQATLIERTARRGHKRIPKDSPAAVSVFVQRAVETFDSLMQELITRGRLRHADEDGALFVRPNLPPSPAVDGLLAVARACCAAALEPVTDDAQRPSARQPKSMEMRRISHG